MAEFMSFLKIFKVDYARVSVEAMIEKYRIFGINVFFLSSRVGLIRSFGLSYKLCKTRATSTAPIRVFGGADSMNVGLFSQGKTRINCIYSYSIHLVRFYDIS